MVLQNRNFWLSFVLIVLSGGQLFSQAKRDTAIFLITDLNVQSASVESLRSMYNFKFEKSEAEMRDLMKRFSWHPLPYFLLGLNEWWKIMPDTKNTSHDEKFLKYMDSSIMIADNLYEKFPEYRAEAAFFLAAAYGFKGRLYGDEERKNFRKAASVGKSALKYLEICKAGNDLTPELLFGDALYNYFSVWIPENYPALKPLLLFFKKGDKQLGLKQLKECSFNAFYTRIEAMIWLMRISNSYENDQAQAWQLADYLYHIYPDNPYFHRYYARMLYSRGMYKELEPSAKSILARIDSGMTGYEATSGRYAAFYLGQLYQGQKKLELASLYYRLSCLYAEKNDSQDSGYYLYSLIELGQIAQSQGKKEEARKFFAEVKKRAGRKDEAYKDAKRRLKNLEKGD